MTRRHRETGFTLSEMIVSIAASVVVIGGLLTGSITLQKALLENERRVARYADQRRLIDYVARDLRRALTISVADAAGTRPVAGEVLTLDSDGTSLVLTLPGYYRSEDPASAGYDQPLEVRHYSDGATYGTAALPAPTATVTYRKAAKGRTMAFIRKESGKEELVTASADALSLRMFFAENGRLCDLEAIHQTNERGYRQVVSSFEQAMLRNPPVESSE